MIEDKAAQRAASTIGAWLIHSREQVFTAFAFPAVVLTRRQIDPATYFRYVDRAMRTFTFGVLVMAPLFVAILATAVTEVPGPIRLGWVIGSVVEGALFALIFQRCAADRKREATQAVDARTSPEQTLGVFGGRPFAFVRLTIASAPFSPLIGLYFAIVGVWLFRRAPIQHRRNRDSRWAQRSVWFAFFALCAIGVILAVRSAQRAERLQPPRFQAWR